MSSRLTSVVINLVCKSDYENYTDNGQGLKKVKISCITDRSGKQEKNPLGPNPLFFDHGSEITK